MGPPASPVPGPPLKNDPAEESTGSAVPLPKKDGAPAAPPPNMLKSPFESPELEASEDLVGEGAKLKKLILRPMSIDLKLFIQSNFAANETFYILLMKL